MTFKPDDPMFPVVDITVGSIKSHEIVLIRPDFIASPMQSTDAPNPGRIYVLSLQQARNLVLQINQQLHRFESDTSQPPIDPKH